MKVPVPVDGFEASLLDVFASEYQMVGKLWAAYLFDSSISRQAKKSRIKRGGLLQRQPSFFLASAIAQTEVRFFERCDVTSPETVSTKLNQVIPGIDLRIPPKFTDNTHQFRLI